MKLYLALSLFANVIALAALMLSSQALIESRRLRGLMATKTRNWGSASLQLGDSFNDLMLPLLDKNQKPTLSDGFYLCGTDLQGGSQVMESLNRICEFWQYKGHLIIEHRARMQRDTGFNFAIVKVKEDLSRRWQLSSPTIILVKDGRILDCAADIYHPVALRERFQLTAGQDIGVQRWAM